MKENKITQPESREIQRSDINFANYNPRKITQEARKNLKANLKRVGLLVVLYGMRLLATLFLVINVFQ